MRNISVYHTLFSIVDDYHTALVLNHIIELLTFCIETHTYHMKNYCFNRDLLKRVLVLLLSSHKFLVLGRLTHTQH